MPEERQLTLRIARFGFCRCHAARPFLMKIASMVALFVYEREFIGAPVAPV